MRKLVIAVTEGGSHTRWERGDYDLVVACRDGSLSPEDAAGLSGAGTWVTRCEGTVWQAINTLVNGRTPGRGRGFPRPLDYDLVWVAGPDIDPEPGAADTLFRVMEEHGLDLAQPSLAPGTQASHALTLHRGGCLLRLTDFVEASCPAFSRRGLAACRHTFGESPSGWGLDAVWPGLLGGRPGRIGIVDAAVVSREQRELSEDERAAAIADYDRVAAMYGAGPLAPKVLEVVWPWYPIRHARSDT